MTATVEHVFNNLADVRLLSDISDSTVSIDLVEGFVRQLMPGWVAGKELYLTLVDGAANREIVKVTAISGNTITATRAQDGTAARPWYAGTLISQRLVAANLGEFSQKAAFQTIAYNPHGLLTPAYPGEEVLETGVQDCKNRWWKNVGGTNWRLIAGTICPTEYYVDGYVFENLWDLYFDNTDWKCGSACVWSGTSWDLTANPADPGHIVVADAAVWQVGYRPDKVRITFTGDSPINLAIGIVGGGRALVNTDITSTEEINLSFAADKDILWLGYGDDYTPWHTVSITSIEFFES